MATFMSSHLSPIQGRRRISPPSGQYIRPRSKTHTEFGIITQLDYNKMRMPEDRLYSAGRQIIFPQQGIPTASIGGGFSFAIGHPRWAVETGMIYNPKTFKPGRQLIVGGAFDNGSVEFEAMRLQMVSVPLQFRYRFDHKGFFKAYGLAGFGLHLIAQSDVDVLIKYHFPSLSFGQDPNNVPQLAETIRETRRISEHIRDGAPFSTKSYFSINAGAGVEYSLSENKTIFLQSTVLYQVPNLKFSNNNGKHIRSLSLQAGVRTPLGH
jgi:opacity protein-like surface antigen